ncbi:hypothetical protein C8Q70DRAFT_566268 [Cubamyces menziesii]|nr:hypothetical protein C8Q70DRAFT_566268 [Cubamyces menziesii]
MLTSGCSAGQQSRPSERCRDSLHCSPTSVDHGMLYSVTTMMFDTRLYVVGRVLVTVDVPLLGAQASSNVPLFAFPSSFLIDCLATPLCSLLLVPLSSVPSVCLSYWCTLIYVLSARILFFFLSLVHDVNIFFPPTCP